jgi:uncharacterized membrane-anchored protein YhcB (DUF1043 family)
MHSLQTFSGNWGSTLWLVALVGSVLLLIIGFIFVKKRAA